MTPTLYTAALPGGGAAVMDVRAGRGRWQHLNATAARLWELLADGDDPALAVEHLVAAFAEQGADPAAVRTDLSLLLEQLRALGLLSGTAAEAASVPTEVTVRPALPEETRLRVGERAAGAAGLVLALILLRCAPVRTSIAVGRAVARLPLHPAGPDRADRLFAAVRRAGRAWPGRVACLEESLACYLAAALRGRGVAWVIGARTAPAGAHAWNEAGGQVIGQDAGDRVWPYAPALALSPRTRWR
ncbi:lasso peptide biosynthesis B2 protein [Streptomyces sp. RFCAC02]|uniref:lasso peptide biosynthesis B2 protein n=1 Tax=Streptomyces sp. RFCAC02 TaxID=2499143 RepID=UPI001020D687|nr:lasso peptide biosynthesis B2 protein [Streptomyces sp. RFCAC02]